MPETTVTDREGDPIKVTPINGFTRWAGWKEQFHKTDVGYELTLTDPWGLSVTVERPSLGQAAYEARRALKGGGG